MESIVSNLWDEMPAASGNYITFDKVGDSAAGVITSLTLHTWPDGQVSPQIGLKCDDGEDRTLTAGQLKLKAALREHRPEVGDRLEVELEQIEKRAGGKTLKWFRVVVTRAGMKAASPVAAAPTGEHPQAAALRAAGVSEDAIKAALGL